MADPRATEAIVRRLHKEAAAALQLPDIRDAMSRQGQEVVTSSPAELSALIKRELAANAEIVRKADIRPE